MRLISTTELTAHRRCREEHHINYNLKVRPLAKPAPLRVGSGLHAALEVWWKTCGDLDAATDALNAVEDVDPYERALLGCLLATYHSRWYDSDLEVMGVEVPFECDIVHPVSGVVHREFRLCGKIDAVVRRGTETFIVEHKSASEPVNLGSIYWSKLRMNPQISTYYVGAASLGLEIAGCIYDVISKPKVKPLKATPPELRKYTKAGALYANQREEDESVESYEARVLEELASAPDLYLTRGDVIRTPDELHAAALDLWNQCEDMSRGIVYRNPDACFRYGDWCPYYAVCAHGASLTDPTRFRLARSVSV